MGRKFYKNCRATVLLFLLIACSPFRSEGAPQSDPPDLFTYQELERLYDKEEIAQDLESKLNRLLNTPFVDNSRRSSTPLRFSRSLQLGEFLRVVQWNIERGLEYEAVEAAFSSETQLESLLDKEKFPPGSEERRKVMEQAAMLRAADVIILNEVDWGVKRTDYRNIAGDLAARLGMNYAFGVQYLELTPVRYSREPKRADSAENEVVDLFRVDPSLYRGMHGIAILSRFPLENVRLIPFKHQPYDWYKSEKEGTHLLEKGKRELSKRVFLEETLREVRRGGRMSLLADIADARLPAGRVTVVATHLEARTKPANRTRQLEELLDEIKEFRHPVIVAGDMNTTAEDLTPTSFRREFIKRVGSPKFWIKKGLNYTLGFGLIEDFLITGLSFGRAHADPTVRHIPFFSPNPTKKFFTTLEDFRFADGGAFDFRGNPSRSTGGSGNTLSDSNERAGKGFVTTYQVNRPIKFVGKYKLDWIFVKPPALTDPSDRKQSYRFAPHFGRTLVDLNEIVEGRISDHRPILVDLPLDEPQLGREQIRQKKGRKPE